MINMDYMMWLPPTPRRYESIWVIINRLTKSAHLFALKNDIFSRELCLAFHSRDFSPSWGSIIYFILSKSSCYCTFVDFFKRLDTQLNLSIAFHPLINGRSEHIIQTIGDKIGVCMLDFKES